MATTQEKEFFNLHVSGIGYLSRVRWVEPGKRSAGRRSAPFLACSISALRGSSDEVSYTYFDVRVTGEDAVAIIESLQKDVEERRKVIVSFRLGDIYPHLYERDVRDANRKPTGAKEMATLIKGRLLLINSVSVDGERVYTREEAPEGDANADEQLGDDAGHRPIESQAAVMLSAAPTPERSATAKPTADSSEIAAESRNRPSFLRVISQEKVTA